MPRLATLVVALLAVSVHSFAQVATDTGGSNTTPPQKSTVRGGEITGGISTTPDNQIILELAPDDTADPNPVDLEGRTLVFTPDGHGGYSRSVQPLAWEDHLGEAVADEAMVELQSFRFDFAGQRWGAFHVSRHGLLTFGGPFAWSYVRDGRSFTMSEIAAAFVQSPTISPLYAPAFGAWGWDDPESSRFVAHWPDRIVVTWIVRDVYSNVDGVIKGPNRFQAVLHADGGVQFNYADVTSGDGIAGLFSNVVQKGDLIASVVDATDPGVPGHLDLLDAAIYTSNTNAVILEFTLRDSIRDPPAGELYSYRLHFDTDEPYWNHPLDWSDEDATWLIDVREGGEYTALGKGVRGFLAGKGEARISLLADASVLQRDGRGIRAMAVAGAAHFRGDQWVQGDDSSRALLQFPAAGAQEEVDLSTADRSFSPNQHEVFHNRGVPDLEQLACRVIDNLGDEFDFMVFHNEFEVDSQEPGSPVAPYGAHIPGTGGSWGGPPCGNGRLKALLIRPISMHTFGDGDLEHVLGQVAHEFGHVWSAYISYVKEGHREPLVDDLCRCHWRFDLHTPAPFPPRGRREAGSHMSALLPGTFTGGFWRENADGTFTPGQFFPERSGPSWLDLYLMGLADVHEVPDMFILRNLKPLSDGSGAYTADKETVTIEQIVAAEGPRVPSVANSQKVFNAGFVYLVERGQKPAADLLQLHARYIGELRDRWFGFTGERSRIMTETAASRPAVSVSAATPWSLTVMWNEPAGGPFNDYDVRYRTSGSSGQFTALPHDGPARTATITGLAPDTAYEIQVRAVDDTGPGAWSALVQVRTDSLLPGVAGSGFPIRYFPHLAVGTGWQTTITYINYSEQDVTCETHFLADNGGALRVSFPSVGTVDSRTDVLPPGATVHEETDVALTDPLAAGWAVAACSGPVKASLLYRRYDSETGMPTGEAGVNAAAAPATRFVTFAEQAVGLPGTGVAYANPSSTAAEVTFRARDTAGAIRASSNLTLPPGEHGAQNVASLFGASLSGLTGFTGWLEVTATEPVVSLSLNFEAAPVFSSLPPGQLDAVGLGAATYYFPHLAVGTGWQTTITYINYSEQDVTCETHFLADNGGALRVSFPSVGTVDSRTDVLPPGATVHEETDVALTDPLAAGWARASCSGPVKASLLYRRYDEAGQPAGEAGVNAAAAPATRFVTFAEQAVGLPGTGVAYANPSASEMASITFTARDADGNMLATVGRSLLPEGHDAGSMKDLFGGMPFVGSLEVTSTKPIVSLSINFEADPVFSSLPPGNVGP